MRAHALASAYWIKPVAIASPQRALSFTGLDLGEAEVLVLAEEVSASLVIVDERRARRQASRMGFPITGTVGILLLAKNEGLVERVQPLLLQLLNAGLFLDPAIIQHALMVAGEA